MAYDRTVRFAVASSLALLLVAQSDAAAAYCRTSGCPGGEGTRCEPAQAVDCGTPVAWARDCIGFAVFSGGSVQVSVDEAAAQLHEGFSKWLEADCNPGTPHIRVLHAGEVGCPLVEYNLDGGNANVLVFRDEVWTHEEDINALALTTVTYDIDTFEIYDADMEVNSTPEIRFVVGEERWYDLPAVLTHEAGHALGMAHSSEPDATMFAFVPPGDTRFRDLEPDDIAGICAIYPPGDPIEESCNPIPKHGFSDRCMVQQAHGSCALSPESSDIDEDAPSPVGPWWLLALLLARRRHAPP